MTIRTTPPVAHTASAGRLSASVRCENGRVLIDISRSGELVVEGIAVAFSVNGTVVGVESAIESATNASVADSYRKYTGKVVGELSYRHDEMRLEMAESGGLRWTLLVRVAVDGVAFRYVVASSHDEQWVGPDATRIPAPPSGRAWLLDYQTWYETPRFGRHIAELAAGDYGFPALVTADDSTFVLYSESAIDGRNSGAHLRFDDGDFLLVTADDRIEAGSGYESPWRVAIVGGLDDVVRSNLVDELAPAADPAQDVVTRPGRGAWSWWSSQYSGAYLDDQKRFADYAAKQGWEHLLVDCGWDAAWVPELVAYASERGIQVHLWSSWSDLDGPDALKKLALWRSWGVAGIKVDFMESESQVRYRWYDAIIAETARVGLMVNFHGSVIPRGWARTHPQVVSYEGIRGAEYYVFYGTPLTAAHNVIQPFTRNVVGSMDYTPVTFSAPQRETSDGHELALGVVYESGITHFADDPREYEARPLADALLAEIAPSWDEVRLIGGHPDREAVVARRSAGRWFVGCIASGPARTIDFDPSRLVEGPADVWVVGDDVASGTQLVELSFESHSGVIRIPVAENGGFVAIVVAAGAPLKTAAPRVREEGPTIEPAVATHRGEASFFTTDAAATVRVSPGWAAVAIGDGVWSVTSNDAPEPGSVCVVTAELAGGAGIPVVGHARLFAAYDSAPVELSSLPFLSARNQVGPVERDESNGGGDPHDGKELTVAGELYATGLGVSGDSSVRFHLGEQATRLSGSVGADDEVPDSAARVLVVVDDTVRLEYTVASGQAAQPVDLDLSGALVLELRTEPVDEIPSAHVDWLGLKLST